MKSCGTCRIEQPLDNYYVRGNTGKHANQCKACYLDRARRNRWQSRYGITPDEYEALSVSQGGRCAICGIPQEAYSRLLAVDHDHATGEVRGLLCDNCNRGIGHLQDSPEILMSAAAYLIQRESNVLVNA